METFRVHILGCGSALPTLRHFPSIQVIECRGKLFMMDCGEGAQLQVRRSRLSFARIGHIFISHSHGDHCLGLTGMISTFGLLGRTAPLHVYAPKEMERIFTLQVGAYCSNISYEVVFHPVDTTAHSRVFEDRSMEVWTLPLDHRVPCCGYLFREKPLLPHIRPDMMKAYDIPASQVNNIKAGASFTLPDGTVIPHERLTTPPDPSRSYAYCSDTRYLPNLHELLAGVDTLYHEATYSDAKLANAEKYCHSTARQAAQVARDAQVRQLVIGHFSARYTDGGKMENATANKGEETEQTLLEQAREVFKNTFLASEMQIFDV